MIVDLRQYLLGGRAADIGIRAGAKSFGHLHAHLNDAPGFRHCERLGVGIGDDKIDPLQSRADHVVNGIAARTGEAKTHHGLTRAVQREPRRELP